MRGPYEWIADQGWPEPVEIVAAVVATPLIVAGMVGGVIACGLAIGLVQTYAVLVLLPPVLAVLEAVGAIVAPVVEYVAGWPAWVLWLIGLQAIACGVAHITRPR